jgi:hypothetical protein
MDDVQPVKRPPPPQLSPWKPGQSGNPGGKPKSAMGAKDMAMLICKLFNTSKKDVMAILDNSDLKAVEHIVARQISICMEKGDVGTFIALCDRAFGKQKERLEASLNRLDASLSSGEKVEPASIADFIRSVAKAA